MNLCCNKSLSTLGLLVILICGANALFFNSRKQEIEFYENLVHTEIKKAYSYVLPKDNSEFWEGGSNTSETIELGSYDFIIVGAGTAGTVVANGLSAIPSIKVLLLEAGGPENAFSDIPGMITYLQGSRMNWGYRTTPQKHSCFANVDNKCNCARGKVIGGCSTINALLNARGNKDDYDQWESLGNPTWSYKDLLPYFIRQENYHVKGDPGYHGYSGPVDVENPTPWLPLSDRYLKGFEELGFDVLDYNGARQIGIDIASKFTRKGRRLSGGRAFLDPVLKRKNLKLIMYALVTKILIENDSAVGVEFMKSGQRYRAYSSKEIIVSGGSINTPQLLMLSGIGPKKELSKYNIPVIKDLPVGQYLKDHLYIPTAFSTNQYFNTTLDEYIAQYVDHKGALTTAGGNAAIGFTQTNNKTFPPGLPNAEHLITSPNSRFAFTGDDASKYGDTLTVINQNNSYTVFVILLKPKSTGTVTLQSNDPKDFPLIDPNYLSDPNNEDIETYYQSARFLLKLSQTKVFKEIDAKFVDMNIPTCKKYELYSREYFYCHARNLGTTIFHPLCTARMGPEGKNTVVDYRLRVHGIKNLRVADGSVMPEIIAGHPMAVIFVIGQKLVDFVLEDNKLK